MCFKHLSTIAVGSLVTLWSPLAGAGTQYIALAIGKSDRLGAGLGWYQASKEGAEADALAGCRRSIPDGDCKIVLSGANACISLHFARDGGNYGAAMRSTRPEAENASLTDCSDSNECYLVNSWCIE